MRSTKLDNEILDATKNSTHEECVPSLGVQFKNISAWRREQVYCKTLQYLMADL